MLLTDSCTLLSHIFFKSQKNRVLRKYMCSFVFNVIIIWNHSVFLFKKDSLNRTKTFFRLIGFNCCKNSCFVRTHLLCRKWRPSPGWATNLSLASSSALSPKNFYYLIALSFISLSAWKRVLNSSKFSIFRGFLTCFVRDICCVYFVRRSREHFSVNIENYNLILKNNGYLVEKLTL